MGPVRPRVVAVVHPILFQPVRTLRYSPPNLVAMRPGLGPQDLEVAQPKQNLMHENEILQHHSDYRVLPFLTILL
jgi:hypothetical protein